MIPCSSKHCEYVAQCFCYFQNARQNKAAATIQQNKNRKHCPTGCASEAWVLRLIGIRKPLWLSRAAPKVVNFVVGVSSFLTLSSQVSWE
jgi:hypothetical protein